MEEHWTAAAVGYEERAGCEGDYSTWFGSLHLAVGSDWGNKEIIFLWKVTGRAYRSVPIENYLIFPNNLVESVEILP